MIDEIALLRESDAVPELDEGRLAAIRASLDAAIAEERFAAASRLPHRRRPWLVGAAVAAVAAAIALPVATSGGPAPRGACATSGERFLPASRMSRLLSPPPCRLVRGSTSTRGLSRRTNPATSEPVATARSFPSSVKSGSAPTVPGASARPSARRSS